MTTIDHAAAMSVRKPGTLAVVIAIAAVSLGGCETSSNLFGSSAAPSLPAVADQQAPPPVTQRAKIAVAPVIGPPDTAVKLVQAQLVSAIERQKITVAKLPTDPSEYTLRGYIVAAKEKTGSKMSYIWDVTDPAGKRVNRFTGEEVVPGKLAGSDPWVALTPQVIEKITSKMAAQVGTWLPTQGAPASIPIASAAPAAGAPLTTGAPANASDAFKPPSQSLAAPPVTPASAGAVATNVAAVSTSVAPAGPTTGSIGSGPVTALVASVTGAPGDGTVSLTSAMQKALASKGIALADKPGGQTYRVQGKVAVGQPQNGKQSIQIDWVVTDPQGNFYKRVSQTNEIPQGMLEGPWGQTADLAAAPAASEIANLLPKAKQASAAPITAAPN